MQGWVINMLVSLIAVYSWDDTVLDNLTVPIGMDVELLKEELLREIGELSILYSDPEYIKAYLGIFSRRKLPVWTRMYQLAEEEYDPIDNYKRTVTETTTHGHKEQVDYLDNSELSGSEHNRVFGFDSSDESVGKDSTSASSEGEHSGQNIKQHSGNDVVVTQGQGNIGVTTYQKMVEEELKVRPKLDIYKLIIDDIKKEFCVCVY